MQVVINNLLTSYEDHGKGPVVLALHGWADSKATFHKLSPSLTKNYRLIAVDLPGFGASNLPEGTWDLQKYSEFVAAFLEKIDAKKPYAIIGHSNGGAIAIKGLASGVLKADKLVLIASAGVRNKQAAKKKALKMVAKSGKLATSVLPKNYKDKLQDKFYKQIGSDAMILPHMRETFVKIVGEDLQTQAENVTAKTLLIYGDSDRSTPAEYGQLLHQRIKHSELKIIPGQGHFVHQMAAEEVGNLIQTFLEKKS